MCLNFKISSLFFFALLNFSIFSSAAQCAEVRLDPNPLFVDEAKDKWYEGDNKGNCILDKCLGTFNYLCKKGTKDCRVLRFLTQYTCTIQGLLETAKDQGQDFCYPGSLYSVANDSALSLIQLKEPTGQKLSIGTGFGTIDLHEKKKAIRDGSSAKTKYILMYSQPSRKSTSQNSYELAVLSKDSVLYILGIIQQITEKEAEYTINLTELDKLKTLGKDKIIKLDDAVINRIFTRTYK